MLENYISVGIDVGSSFSWMSIVDPQENIILKPFKVIHNNSDSLKRALSEIKKAEELHSLKSRTFLESTGIYHFPLFCYLMESGFEAFVINPLIIHSIKNYGIRKVKNDKIDSIGLAKLGLKKDLKTSVLPTKLVLELRSLCRKYYELVDTRSSYVNRLKTDMHTVFPQYLDIFSDITGSTSIMILKEYSTPDKILRGHRTTVIEKISKCSRKGLFKATIKYEQLIQAAKASKIFGCNIDSIYFNISINIKLIEELNSAINSILEQIHSLVEANYSDEFVKQVYWLDSIPGIGFLSAVTIMCEIGDFSSFKNPKQLFAYFGLDPSVNQSGNFNATEVHMSKRGSRIARRAIFAVALASIRTKRNGEAINPILHEYYIKKSSSKPKMVAIGAVMHKVCNFILPSYGMKQILNLELLRSIV
ncbi:IS110 family transposase [Sedimentibacter saalensis]|uniref:Transposase n=1 Tax=Sedimentibacter saalensis TaxID=130788 RepID=A0A562JKH1_9FIRM|nr:IS110 family transposase [Sedimentibacter saalensis]TWH83453.1 transposase [Sedimentibacter saalensis]